MITEGSKEDKIAEKVAPQLKGVKGKELRDKVHDMAREAGVDYVKLMKKIEKLIEDEEEVVDTPEQDDVQDTPTDTTPPEPEDAGGDDFTDLNIAPETAKALDRLEGKFGLRPDFDVGGHPGFYASSEKEWYNNMKADRQRMRFKSDGKITQFMRKHPHSNFYVRNPNKASDFMYPAHRKNKKRPRSRA